MILFGADKYVREWVQDRLKMVFPENSVALGVIREKKLVAGIIYHNYFPEYGNIELTIASDHPSWATRQAIRTILSYPFRQLKCQRITATIRESNDRALRFNLGIGFKVEGRLVKGFGNEDMLITGLLKENAQKWLRG